MKKRSGVQAAEKELVELLRFRLPRRTYREFNEIFVSEFVSITGGVLAGAMLAQYLDKIALIPGILILIPGFLEMRGNISGSLAARLSVLLHLNLLDKHPRIKHANIWAAFTLGLVVSLFLGIIAYLATLFFFKVNAPLIILIAVIAGLISNILMIPMTAFFTVWLFRHGYDPDNIMGPYVTTIGDLVSVLSLIIAIVVV